MNMHALMQLTVAVGRIGLCTHACSKRGLAGFPHATSSNNNNNNIGLFIATTHDWAYLDAFHNN